MTTVLDLITGAARLIGVTYVGEALSSEEANDGLAALNGMIASWGNNSLLIEARAWETFSISPASSYTIGAGQTLNTARPIDIRFGFVRINGIDYEMEAVSDEQFESISQKTQATTWPLYFNYDNAYPTGTIRLWPLITAAATLGLLTEKPITEFATINDTVNLAPGWIRALRYNLAVEIAPEYGAEVSASVAKIAADSLGAISLAIAKNRPIKFKPAYVRRNGFFDGYYW